MDDKDSVSLWNRGQWLNQSRECGSVSVSKALYLLSSFMWLAVAQTQVNKFMVLVYPRLYFLTTDAISFSFGRMLTKWPLLCCLVAGTVGLVCIVTITSFSPPTQENKQPNAIWTACLNLNSHFLASLIVKIMGTLTPQLLPNTWMRAFTTASQRVSHVSQSSPQRALVVSSSGNHVSVSVSSWLPKLSTPLKELHFFIPLTS